MRASRHRRALLFAAVVALSLRTTIALADPAPKESDDPLAIGRLPETSVSVDMKDADIVQVFRMLAAAGEVPFLLDFAAEPALKVTFRAEQMSLRTILQSLADTYGLDYQADAAGIVVRRKGRPGVPAPVTIGAWPPVSGVVYNVVIDVTDGTGSILASPRLKVAAQSLGTIKVGLPNGREVLALDRKRLIAEPRYAGIVQLNFSIKKETTAGIEVLAELTVDHPAGDAKISEERQVATLLVGKSPTTLFATEDVRILMKDWSRQQ